MGIPVVIIPGLMGSSLYRTGFTGGKHYVWYNSAEMVVNGPDNLDLAVDGLSPGPLAEGALSPGGSVGLGFYDALVNQFNAALWTPYFFAYDWRHPVLYTATRLVNYLLDVAPHQDFYVVAHSLGGLLARAAVPLYAAKSDLSNWRRTIYLGTPHGGSYDAAAALCAFNPPEGLTFFLASNIGLLARRITRPFSSLASLQDRYLQVIASWPSIYDLLPTNQGPWSADDPLAFDGFKVATFRPFNKYVEQSRLTAGLTTQVKLSQYLLDPRPAEVCVVGDAPTTRQQYLDLAKIDQNAGYVLSNDGDGVVSRRRATLPGVATVSAPSPHANLPRDPGVLAQIESWLTNGVPEDKTLPLSPAPAAAPRYSTLAVPPPLPPSPFTQIRADP